MTILLSVLFGLLSMISYGFANAYSKPLSQQLGMQKMLLLRGIPTCAILLIASIPTMDRLQGHVGSALLTLALGVFGYLPVLAFTAGIQKNRLGVITPIASTAPLITVVLSYFFLDVELTTIEWFAISAVVVANISVCINFADWKSSHLFQFSSGVPYAFIAAFGWGLFFLLLVSSTRTLGPWLSVFIVEVGVTLAAALHVKLSDQPCRLREALRIPVAANGLAAGIGTVSFAIGVNYYNVGIVAALSNSVALVTSILGVILFKETLHNREKVAAAVMIAGVTTLPLFGG